jgi:hypothetical protein
MTTKPWPQIDYFPIALIALMALTRFHHFGDVLHLPDASLAVFFFAGFYRKKMLFVFLLALAALIDFVTIKGGTSSWCISPAYVFLIPTYGVMWLTGRYIATTNSLSTLRLAKSFSLLTLATSIAFVISNGSFYLLSDKYAEVSWGQYLQGIAQYFPLYAGSAVIYVLLGYALTKAWKVLAGIQQQHSSH